MDSLPTLDRPKIPRVSNNESVTTSLLLAVGTLSIVVFGVRLVQDTPCHDDEEDQYEAYYLISFHVITLVKKSKEAQNYNY